MQILKCLHLILIVTLLSSYQAQCNEDIKMEYLFNQVIEPYNVHLNSFTQEFKSTFSNPLSFILLSNSQIEKALTEDDLDYVASPPRGSEFKKVSELNSPDHVEVGDGDRMLQAFSIVCLNGGVAIQANASRYICDGQIVSKTDYEARNKVDCSIDSSIQEYCYCPYDYYGAQCENFNRVACEITRISHPITRCVNTNSKYYVYTHEQSDMPCYPVEKDSIIEMEFNVKCKNSESKWNYEGIKLEGDFDYQIINKPENPFPDYHINTPELKMSFYEFVELALKFMNWRRVFKPRVFRTPMTAEEVAGMKNVVFVIDMSLVTEEYRLSGRYFYEVVLDFVPIYNKLTGTLEEYGYVEPKKIVPSRDYELFDYLIVVCIFIGLVFIGFKYKDIKWRPRRPNYEPFTDMIHLHDD